MTLMQKITILINKYINSVKHINSDKLANSGTGYIYPSLCDTQVVQFIDQYGRLGYLFQLVVTNKNDKTKKRSCFLVHCRNSSDGNNIVYSGLNELYSDCRVRQYDEEKFLQRLELLLKGETIENWYQQSTNSNEKDLQFELSASDIESVEQRPFLSVVDPIY